MGRFRMSTSNTDADREAALEKIRALARTCAASNLRLRQARYLFDAMVMSDALFLEGGDVLAASRRLEVDRAMIQRRLKTKED